MPGLSGLSRVPRFLTGIITGWAILYLLSMVGLGKWTALRSTTLKSTQDTVPIGKTLLEQERIRDLQDNVLLGQPQITIHQDGDSEEQASQQAHVNTGKPRLRISCWIMTNPANLESRSRYIQRTWAKRCDKAVFISSVTNPNFPAVGINVSEGRDYLTQKTLGGYHYVYHHHLDDCDWFFKGDDDTYLIVENLRHFLEDYDTNDPIYFGHHFRTLVKQGYSSGGSGLVVSKEALRRFGKEGNKSRVCRQTGTGGDVAFGQCMQNLGIKIRNSTDSQGRSRFHCFSPMNHIMGGYPDWYFNYDANGAKQGMGNVSDYPISFHYVGGQKQLELDFLLYHARVHDHDGYQHDRD